MSCSNLGVSHSGNPGGGAFCSICAARRFVCIRRKVKPKIPRLHITWLKIVLSTLGQMAYVPGKCKNFSLLCLHRLPSSMGKTEECTSRGESSRCYECSGKSHFCKRLRASQEKMEFAWFNKLSTKQALRFKKMVLS